MSSYAALLRAVNVAGTGKVDMKKLRAACEKAGLRRVSTYIQSGNVVFESAKSPKALKALIERLLREKFGVASVCILRTGGQLAEVIRRNPFPDAAEARPNRLLTTFLDGKPASGAVEALAQYKGLERIYLSGEALYVDYGEGYARSKLSPARLERATGRAGTARNWNTVNRLLEMSKALER